LTFIFMSPPETLSGLCDKFCIKMAAFYPVQSIFLLYCSKYSHKSVRKFRPNLMLLFHIAVSYKLAKLLAAILKILEMSI
jgi:hypothetical protein